MFKFFNEVLNILRKNLKQKTRTFQEPYVINILSDNLKSFRSSGSSLKFKAMLLQTSCL